MLLSLLAFTGSAAFVVVLSLAAAGTASSDARERYWVFISVTSLQLGTLSTIASLFHQLTPQGWIMAQCILTFPFFYFLSTGMNCSLKEVFSRAASAALEWTASFRRLLSGMSPAVFWLIGIVIVLFISGMQQCVTPITGFDDRMYRASRVAYWMQNHSVFPYVTHNDRQVVFSFGSELFFLWPLLFTKTELIGRMIFWLGFPAFAAGLYLLLRELGLNTTFSLACVFSVITTPIVLRLALGLNQEIWLSAFILGGAFWCLKAWVHPESIRISLLFAALHAMMAIGVKYTALALLPAVVLLSFMASFRHRIRAFKYTIAGILIGLTMSGLIVPLGFNQAAFGNPLGPQKMLRVHASDVGLLQLYTHTVRFPFLLFDLPAVPSVSIRETMTAWGKRIASWLGADHALRLETEGEWPGAFAFTVPKYASRFSSGGLIWLPVLGVALYTMIQKRKSNSNDFMVIATLILFILEISLLLGILYGNRWQTGAELPDRFLVTPYVLAMAMAAVLAYDRMHNKRRLLSAISFVILLTAVIPVASSARTAYAAVLQTDANDDRRDDPLDKVLTSIPAGSNILLVANQDTPDYDLFNPGHQFSNKVISWGKTSFDESRMRSLIDTNSITHIVLVDDKQLDFHWDTPVSTEGMGRWLAGQSHLEEVPLSSGPMRLFKRVI